MTDQAYPRYGGEGRTLRAKPKKSKRATECQKAEIEAQERRQPTQKKDSRQITILRYRVPKSNTGVHSDDVKGPDPTSHSLQSGPLNDGDDDTEQLIYSSRSSDPTPSPALQGQPNQLGFQPPHFANHNALELPTLAPPASHALSGHDEIQVDLERLSILSNPGSPNIDVFGPQQLADMVTQVKAGSAEAALLQSQRGEKFTKEVEVVTDDEIGETSDDSGDGSTMEVEYDLKNSAEHELQRVARQRKKAGARKADEVAGMGPGEGANTAGDGIDGDAYDMALHDDGESDEDSQGFAEFDPIETFIGQIFIPADQENPLGPGRVFRTPEEPRQIRNLMNAELPEEYQYIEYHEENEPHSPSPWGKLPALDEIEIDESLFPTLDRMYATKPVPSKRLEDMSGAEFYAFELEWEEHRRKFMRPWQHEQAVAAGTGEMQFQVGNAWMSGALPVDYTQNEKVVGAAPDKTMLPSLSGNSRAPGVIDDSNRNFFAGGLGIFASNKQAKLEERYQDNQMDSIRYADRYGESEFMETAEDANDLVNGIEQDDMRQSGGAQSGASMGGTMSSGQACSHGPLVAGGPMTEKSFFSFLQQTGDYDDIMNADGELELFPGAGVGLHCPGPEECGEEDDEDDW